MERYIFFEEDNGKIYSSKWQLTQRHQSVYGKKKCVGTT